MYDSHKVGGRGEYLTKFNTGRLRPEFQPLNYPFVYVAVNFWFQLILQFN